MHHKADVLIVTVTEVESRAVMEVFREATGRDAKSEVIASELYLDLGEIKGSRIFMALSGMGAAASAVRRNGFAGDRGALGWTAGTSGQPMPHDRGGVRVPRIRAARRRQRSARIHLRRSAEDVQ
jgi:hypothetical protein